MEKLASELGSDPEQILALLEQLQGQEGLENVSPDLAELMRNVKREKGERIEEVPTEEIEPEPGFVVKTQDMRTQHKVFINMCGHPRVAAPGNWAGGVIPEAVQHALDNVDNLTEAEAGTLRFPLSMSALRQDTDKKGSPCTTVDCCLNNDVLGMAAKHRPLKSFLIELAVNWVSHKHKMELDLKYKLPKMRYKGAVVETQRIRVDAKPLVMEVKELPEEPTFALRATKAQPLQEVQPQQAKGRTTCASQQQQQSSPSAAAAAHAVQPSTAATATPTASSGAASGCRPGSSQPSSAGFQLVGGVECHGRPVEAMSFVVELLQPLATLSAVPGQQRQQQGHGWSLQGAQVAAEAVRVEVCGRDVFLGAPGCPELRVPLPFAASAQGASVTLEVPGAPVADGCHSAALRVQLQYASLPQLLTQAAAQQPHQFGQLGLANTAALELED